MASKHREKLIESGFAVCTLLFGPYSRERELPTENKLFYSFCLKNLASDAHICDTFFRCSHLALSSARLVKFDGAKQEKGGKLECAQHGKLPIDPKRERNRHTRANDCRQKKVEFVAKHLKCGRSCVELRTKFWIAYCLKTRGVVYKLVSEAAGRVAFFVKICAKK